MPGSRIQLACAVNASYLPHAATMLCSLFDTNAGEHFDVHLFVDADVDSQQQETIRGFVEAKGHSISCRESSANIPAGVPITERFSAAAWFRVLLPDLLPELSRVLYLDVDLLVQGGIRPLWETDLEDAYIGAVNNPLYPQMALEPILALGLSGVSEYFNSGVLLMNLDALRAANVAERVFELARSRPEITRFADQEPLNAALKGKVKFLPPTWNAQNQFFDLSLRRLARAGFQPEQVRQLRSAAAIVHFSGPWKPWHWRCAHSKRSLYDQYRRKTPWSDWQPQRVNWKDGLLRHIPASLQVMWLLFRRRAG